MYAFAVPTRTHWVTVLVSDVGAIDFLLQLAPSVLEGPQHTENLTEPYSGTSLSLLQIVRVRIALQPHHMLYRVRIHDDESEVDSVADRDECRLVGSLRDLGHGELDHRRVLLGRMIRSYATTRITLARGSDPSATGDGATRPPMTRYQRRAAHPSDPSRSGNRFGASRGLRGRAPKCRSARLMVVGDIAQIR
jgi:hypothetical protein